MGGGRLAAGLNGSAGHDPMSVFSRASTSKHLVYTSTMAYLNTFVLVFFFGTYAVAQKLNQVRVTDCGSKLHKLTPLLLF